MPALQAPKYDKKATSTTSGVQLINSTDLASGFLVDAGAQDSTQYVVSLRSSSSTQYVGRSGHGSGGGGSSDYAELPHFKNTDLISMVLPGTFRREDLGDLYSYGSGHTYVSVWKVVA